MELFHIFFSAIINASAERQLHIFQRKRMRSRNFALCGQITCLLNNREILRNLQIYEILPDEHFYCKECLGISPKPPRVESERILE